MEIRMCMYKNLHFKSGNLKDKWRDEQRDLWRNKKFAKFCSKRARLLLSESSPDDVTVEQIREAALKLRNKKEDRLQILKLLTNGFSQGIDKIDAYLEVDISLACLVGLLTGSNSDVQLMAAWCLTNMAASEERQTSILIKHASPYLVTFLSSSSHALQDQCAWTIGNLASNGDSCRQKLLQQGALKPLVLLLSSPSKNVIKSAAFALTNMARNKQIRRDLMSSGIVGDLMRILNDPSYDEDILMECLWLLSYLAVDIRMKGALLMEIETFFKTLTKLLLHQTNKDKLDVQMVTPLVRIIGNVVCELSDVDFHETIVNNGTFIVIGKVLHSGICHLQKEGLWALSNMAAHKQLAIAMTNCGLDKTINDLVEHDMQCNRENRVRSDMEEVCLNQEIEEMHF